MPLDGRPAEGETSLSDPSDLDDFNALLDADISTLANIDISPSFAEVVTTVERQENTVGRSPAAVYVITSEMIRRSGVRTLPDALRLAPGVIVTQLDSSKWAISIRGFATRFSNKLLVQIDGRTVYTPLFAGVFWDVQDVLLEDVERIEVIRGPGASMWGANAVNGVINIITKHSSKTTGYYAEAGGGNQRLFSSARVGGDTKNGSWRIFGKWFDRSEGLSRQFEPTDQWDLTHIGFRIDQQINRTDSITLQGDYYDGDLGEQAVFPSANPPFVNQIGLLQTVGGGNVSMRFSRTYSPDDQWSLLVYYDQTNRDLETIGFREDRHTANVDFQRQVRLGNWHKVVWGMGYRNSSDRIRNDSLAIKFFPPRRSVNWYSIFAQDQITLIEDRWFAIIGSKFSWNDFTGFEIQPTARLLYTPSPSKSIWASVSRAVRVPTRADENVHLTTLPLAPPYSPPFIQFRGNDDLDSETLLAWELGIRSSPNKDFYWDLATFYNRYNHLRGFLPSAPELDPVTGLLVLPASFENASTADVIGFELTSSAKMTERWNLRGAYSFITLDTDLPPAMLPIAPADAWAKNIAYVHSSWSPAASLDLDLIGRYVDNLRRDAIPAYFELDFRMAWQPSDVFEFALVGRNLLDQAHLELKSDSTAGTRATEVKRELFGQAVWRY